MKTLKPRGAVNNNFQATREGDKNLKTVGGFLYKSVLVFPD